MSASWTRLGCNPSDGASVHARYVGTRTTHGGCVRTPDHGKVAPIQSSRGCYVQRRLTLQEVRGFQAPPEHQMRLQQPESAKREL